VLCVTDENNQKKVKNMQCQRPDVKVTEMSFYRY